MELKDYDLRVVPILFISWGLIIGSLFVSDLYDGDISCVISTILLGFLWSFIFILDNGPLYRYIIDTEGIQISCFRGKIGTLSWESVAAVGISRWGRMSSALYISIVSSYQLKASFTSYDKGFDAWTNKINANSLLWRKGIGALNAERPLLILKRDGKKQCRQHLKRLQVISDIYMSKGDKNSIPICTFFE